MEEERPTLIIKKIILDNFKSYYGHLEIGPFHTQFTSIVGPNGSGKSNLIESLLFVFGKKASWMRLSKIHQLIHNSAKHNDVKKASVEVQFQEADGNQISLKRTVHHTGQSNYDINYKHATLEEVTTLLKSKGIDLQNNRFLILQGEVEQISLMKPKSGDVDKPGLLEYLEDIIGSNEYQEKIDRLSEQYLALDVQRREKGEMMRVVEMDLEKLEPGKDKAVQFIRKELKHMQVQNVQQQIQNYKLIQQSHKLQEQKTLLEDKKAILNKESTEMVQQNQEVVKLYKEAKKNLDQKKEQCNQQKSQYDQFREKDNQARNEIKVLGEQSVRLKKNLDGLIQDRSKTIDNQQELSIEIPQKQKDLEEKIKIQQRIEKELQEIYEEQQLRQKETNRLIDQKIVIQNRLHEPTKEKQKLQKTIETLKNKIVKSNEVDQTKGLTKSLNECNQTIQEYESLLDQLNKLQQEIQQRQTNAKEQERTLLQEQQQIINTIQEIKSQLEGRNMQQTQINEQNHVIRAILEASQQGILKGVIGRIGDLGYIDPKYDIAASTAFGALNTILVQDQRCAEQCVQYLRQNRIGRQAFMSLDMITHQASAEMNKTFHPPSRTQRMFDLVKASKQEYQVAFYKVMQNTLVCDTLDIAKELRFAKGIKNRFISLDGKVIEINGTMSGGGQQKKGYMKTTKPATPKKQQLNQENYEAQLKDAQLKRSIIDQDLGKVRNQLAILNTDFSALIEQIREKSVRCQGQRELKQDLEDKLQRQKEIEKEKVNLEKQRKEIEKSILEYEQKILELDELTVKDKAEVEKLEQKIKQSESQALKEKRKEAEEINQIVDKIKGEITKGNRQLIIMEKQLKKYEKEEAQLRENLEKIELDIKRNQDFCTEVEESVLEIVAKLEVYSGQLKQLESDYKEFQKQNQEIQTKIQEMQQKTYKIKQELEETNQAFKKVTEDYKEGLTKLEQIRLNYQETTQEYEFLNDLEEIANWKFQGGASQDLINNSVINISWIEQDESMIQEKKGAILQFDVKEILEIEVNQDIQEEQLVQFCPIEKDLAKIQVQLLAQIKDATNKANINDIQEFKVKYLEYKGRKAEFDDVKLQLSTQKQKIDQLKKERYDLFMHGFNLIGTKLRETYQTLTNGGDAELELVDTMDPFSEGISFSVRPKNKSWKQMSKLSGGEKTLSSLSLIFALHYYKPTPLYFFDEVDAALDYKNVSIVANFIKERTKNAQFIVISLRNNMFELADKLVLCFEYIIRLAYILLIQIIKFNFRRVYLQFKSSDNLRG